MPVAPPVRRAPRVAATFALLVVLAVLASCGTRENNQLGVALIQDQGDLKAVRLLVVDTPDSTREYQLDRPPSGGGSLSTFLVGSRPGFLSTALLRFDSASMPVAGTVVDSAAVELVFRDAFGDTSPLSMRLYAVTSDWAEATTNPDSLPTFAVTPFDSVDIVFPADVVDTVRIALGPIVQGWVNDSATNFGIALLPSDGQDSEAEFDSRESSNPPRLFVYTTDGFGVPQYVTMTPTADTFALAKTAGFTPVIGTPGRLAIARGFPSRIQMAFPWDDLGERATINRAELVLHLDTAASRANSFSVGVQRIVSEPWAGDSTDVDDLLFGVTAVNATQDSVSFAITSIVDQLLSDENHGIQIRAAEERVDTDWIVFHGPDTGDPALKPTLRIWYTPDGTEVNP